MITHQHWWVRWDTFINTYSTFYLVLLGLTQGLWVPSSEIPAFQFCSQYLCFRWNHPQHLRKRVQQEPSFCLGARGQSVLWHCELNGDERLVWDPASPPAAWCPSPCGGLGWQPALPPPTFAKPGGEGLHLHIWNGSNPGGHSHARRNHKSQPEALRGRAESLQLRGSSGELELWCWDPVSQ